jgi:Glyoxalase-like domain
MCNSAPAGAHATDHCYSLAAMHRSRLAGILIDTPAAQVGTEVDFWSAALGAQSYPAPGEEQYTVLVGAAAGLITVVQAVDDAPRYHVDIETDDLAAEVARLTALGAEPVARWQDAHTLRSPGGHLLCVVPVHSDPETFAASARTWP